MAPITAVPAYVPATGSATVQPEGTGINHDYDDAEEEGYNYAIPDNPLVLPTRNRDKGGSGSHGSNDESSGSHDSLAGDDAIAPLPIYGAPPEPFHAPEPEITNLAPPPNEEEELPLAQYGAGRQGRRNRGFGARRHG